MLGFQIKTKGQYYFRPVYFKYRKQKKPNMCDVKDITQKKKEKED